MILCEDEYPKILDEICTFLTPADVELNFVDNETMREINLSQRGIDKTTDVLSFPLVYQLHLPLGCIVINTDLVRQKASELGHDNICETALLFTHGLLHLLGFDHEIDSGEMRDKECEVIEKFNLPKSLIVRTMHED
ncbi:rRNA maturation RNase YbeY [Campylobacter sp.]|uniref:rRNA maturation RNase YbeY n=1 Tax=Campylobacter sp. TaxID=205 RepID=UPI00270484E7|nr:rRNA maturation RNase YbeY [Campylobacter sp.]